MTVQITPFQWQSRASGWKVWAWQSGWQRHVPSKLTVTLSHNSHLTIKSLATSQVKEGLLEVKHAIDIVFGSVCTSKEELMYISFPDKMHLIIVSLITTFSQI